MVVVRLEGVHSVRKRLASGRIATYHYAWRGGPRLEGAPGTPEFLNSYNEAMQTRFTRRRKAIETIADLCDRWTTSPEFDAVKPPSARRYMICVKAIKKRFGTMPVKVIEAAGFRAHVLDWRDSMKDHARSADYNVTTLITIANWAKDRAIIRIHFLDRIGRLAKATPRAEIIWDDAPIARIDLMKKHVRLVCKLALWTGQRQKDLLEVRWSDIDGDFIRLTQSKTGVKVSIYLCRTLREILAECPKVGPFILTNSRARPWTGNGFRASLSKDMKRVGIDEKLTFHDLRGTFENRGWEAGCTEAELFAVTGRKLTGSQSSNAYYRRSDELAKTAMQKIEAQFGGGRKVAVLANGPRTAV